MEQDLTILIVGVEGIGKHELAKSMQTRANLFKIPSLNLYIHTSSTIPTPVQLRVGYDLVIILIDHTMKSSLNIVKDLKPLRRYFILGNACFVCLNGKRRFQREFDFDDLIEIINPYESPIIFGTTKQSPNDWKVVGKSVFDFLLKNKGLQSGHPALPATLNTLKVGLPFHLLAPHLRSYEF